MPSLFDFEKSLMYKAIMSEKTNGIVCECETHPEKGWVKWYDSPDEATLQWADLLNSFEAKKHLTVYYPNQFKWEDGTPDPGDYALVYNQYGELVYYLHIISEYYDVVKQDILDTALYN